MYNYAVKLEKGIGMQYDKTLSLKYFKMGAEKNFLPVMYMYGSMLLNQYFIFLITQISIQSSVSTICKDVFFFFF